MVKGTLARSHTLQASHFMGPFSRVLCSPVPSECEWQVGEKVSTSNKEESGRVRNPMDLKSDVRPFDTALVSQRCVKINHKTTAGQLPLRQLTINCLGDCLQCEGDRNAKNVLHLLSLKIVYIYLLAAFTSPVVSAFFITKVWSVRIFQLQMFVAYAC